MKQIWQIAAGDSARDYSDLFFKHDVMFMGPGSYGPFDGKKYKQLVKKGKLSSPMRGLRRFVEDVKPGDIVLLRKTYRVEAIGIVTEDDYDWNATFDDIYGWNLQHTRRVIWNRFDDLDHIQAAKDLFAERKQIPTFTAVDDPKIRGRIEHLFSQCKIRKPKKLPDAPPSPLELDQVGQNLFSEGLSNEAVDKVLAAIRRQRRLTEWYEEYGKESGRPSEHEVVAHMILPLMLALGWSEQLLAVEWKKIDLACFSQTPTTKDCCVLVCEAKGLGHGLENVFEQAKKYVKNLNLFKCKKILTTDGRRLYLYEKEESNANYSLAGYLNVNLIRTNHIAPAGTNAINTIVSLTPERITKRIST